MVVNLELIHAKCLEPEVGYNRCWLFSFLMLLRFLFPGLAEQLGCVVPEYPEAHLWVKR